MDTTNLGATGTKVSRICLGCMSYGDPKWQAWVLEEEQALPFYRQAWEAGINFWDTANAYSFGRSEEITGKAIRELGIRREAVVVATKVFFPTGQTPNEQGLSAKNIRHAIDASLRRLGLDYVDLYQIHRFDPSTPIEETLEALDGLVKAGKVLHLGASSMFAWQFQRMLHTSDMRGLARFVTMQNHYNLAYREEEREMIPLCTAEGIGLIPWSPLARGLLAGNRRRDGEATTRGRTDGFAERMYNSDDDFAVAEQVASVAAARSVPPSQVALAWLLHQPAVTAPIIGATKPHHIADAVAATALTLSAEEIATLESAYRPHPILGHGYDAPTGAPRARAT